VRVECVQTSITDCFTQIQFKLEVTPPTRLQVR